MPRRRASAGQRARVIRHAYLLYHGGKITARELARTIAAFRPRSTHTS